jgi:hypothetical protein
VEIEQHDSGSAGEKASRVESRLRCPNLGRGEWIERVWRRLAARCGEQEEQRADEGVTYRSSGHA